MPALTKPMVMTVVAPELCIAAVVTAPIPTPIILFPDTFRNSALSLLELIASRLELMVVQATRKIPIPANIDSIAEMINVEFTVSYSPCYRIFVSNIFPIIITSYFIILIYDFFKYISCCLDSILAPVLRCKGLRFYVLTKNRSGIAFILYVTPHFRFLAAE